MKTHRPPGHCTEYYEPLCGRSYMRRKVELLQRIASRNYFERLDEQKQRISELAEHHRIAQHARYYTGFQNQTSWRPKTVERKKNNRRHNRPNGMQ